MPEGIAKRKIYRYRIRILKRLNCFKCLPYGNLTYLLYLIAFWSYSHIFLQGQQVIRFLVIVATLFQPKIRIMTAGAVTVLCPTKEPGGTIPVMHPTWTVSIIMERTHLTLMVSTGTPGKDITTPWRELRWKSDQWRFSTFYATFLLCFLGKIN